MENIIFKPLRNFMAAALSLVLAGVTLNPESNTISIFTLFWITFSGVFIIYRLNDFIDQSRNFKFSVKLFLKNKLHLAMVIQWVLLLIPFTLFYLSEFRFYLLVAIFLLGLLYSINFKINNFTFRIKHIFLLKNIFIGLGWGGLILFGANNYSSGTFHLFSFAAIQVLIGSIIRDIPDIEKDRIEKVHSLPVTFGVNKTIIFLHCINILQLIFFYQISYIAVIIWREIVLFGVQKRNNDILWTQKFNLLTCGMILLWTHLAKFL